MAETSARLRRSECATQCRVQRPRQHLHRRPRQRPRQPVHRRLLPRRHPSTASSLSLTIGPFALRHVAVACRSTGVASLSIHFMVAWPVPSCARSATATTCPARCTVILRNTRGNHVQHPAVAACRCVASRCTARRHMVVWSARLRSSGCAIRMCAPRRHRRLRRPRRPSTALLVSGVITIRAPKSVAAASKRVHAA